MTTGNTYGANLAANLTQSIAPVIIDTNKVVGFMVLASATTFNSGTNTKNVTLSDQTVALSTVTVTPHGADSSQPYTSQYAAMVIPQAQEHLRPWLGYSEFVPNDASGMYSQWYLPSTGQENRKGLGTIGTFLKLTVKGAYTAPSSDSGPDASDGSLTWTSTLNLQGAALDCGFFDFNWVDLFAAASPYDPMRITTTSNPGGGYLKAMVVTGQGFGITSSGGVLFNTIRIIKLKDTPAADYDFGFDITDVNNVTTSVTLTLTVE